MHIARYGDTRVLQLGNVNAIRDWGHAKDFVKAYWMMMQPKDASSVFVVSTGQPASVRDFCHYCY
jgi:GDPmannose 4,6-dehydratase